VASIGAIESHRATRGNRFGVEDPPAAGTID
jgi:hypothetical protein